MVGKASKYAHEVVVVAGAIVIRRTGLTEVLVRRLSLAFKVAREQDANILVTLDGDGQHNPNEIPQILTPTLEGRVDLVVGSRFIGGYSSMPRS